MTTKQISVFLENRPGALAEICAIMEKENIDMRAMCVAEAEDFGILRIIVDDPLNVATTLKDHDYICKITDVLTIEVKDKPGALVSTLNKLMDAGVNIEYSYAFLSRRADRAYLVLRVAKPERALEKLSGSDIRIVPQYRLQEIFS